MGNRFTKILGLGLLSIWMLVGCDDNRDEIEALEAKITQILAQDLRTKITQLENQIKNFPSSDDVAKLKREIDDLKKQIGTGQEELAQANTTIEELQKQITKLEKQPIVAKKVEDLHAPQSGGRGGVPISGEFVKFNFATGETTTSESEWDIAFRATTILVNGGSKTDLLNEPERTGQGGAYIEDGIFDEVKQVSENSFKQDGSAGLAIPNAAGNGWYRYAGPPTHLISPSAGKVIVFRTHDGKYAKVEILSYYKGAPNKPNAFTDKDQHYTFNYAYQPNEGETSFTD